MVWQIFAKGQYSFKPQYCNQEALDILKPFDTICTRILKEHKIYDQVWQMPIILLPLLCDQKPVIVLRPINSSEAMTANFSQLPFPVLNAIKSDFKQQGVGAIWYDITHKPPGTIEWE